MIDPPTRPLRCLDPSESGSCTDNECFCPCDCDKSKPAFRSIRKTDHLTLVNIDVSEVKESFEGSGYSFEGPGSASSMYADPPTSPEKAKSIDIKVAQTNDIINQIDLINKNLLNIKPTTFSQRNVNTGDKNNVEKCYCHCKCCNKSERSLPVENITR